MLKVIIFGPLFTQAERIWNRLLKDELERQSGGKLKVVLPQDQATSFISKSGDIDWDGLVKGCIADSLTNDVAVAILDGPDVDSGTCIEIGFRKGRSKKKLVIGVRTDFRASEDKGLNAMLRICDEIIYFPSFNESAAKLAEKIIESIRLHTGVV